MTASSLPPKNTLARDAHGLCSLGASEAVELLKKREIAPLDLVDAAIARIEQIDPVVNALPLRRFEAAREQARHFPRPDDATLATPGWLGGLPVAVKDYNDLAGLPTTYGSPIYRHNVAARSDLTVANLERHGAIPLAKSNVPEFAGANTFNTVFGATRNPWNTQLTAGGSSGGSAAALAAGMVWLATGNDLGGSLRIPASYCGIVGMRPSVGRVPRPVSVAPYDALWVEGPMGRSVADVALMLDAQSHFDARDPLSYARPPVPFVEAVRHPRGPRRVGFTANLGIGRVEAQVTRICAQAAARFADAGAHVDEGHPDFTGGFEAFQTLRANLVAAVRGPLLASERERICPEIIWNIEKGLRQSGADVARAERLRGELFQRVSAFFDDYDVLACPTVAVAPFAVEQRYPTEIDGTPLDSYIDWMYLTFVLTLTGCPAISIPAGFTDDGRPVGLQLLGRPRGDFDLLGAARVLETTLGRAAHDPQAALA
ncbi:amidase family protein [Caballeronia sp. LZ065]|uniref:amidase n=1 Tax=Caballeronia sp. LZ065 TaxID=3038571 RepID=UPI0028605661|nr:amidase family protein [Caballeronia sp. LZ065]MDR5781490.1 amidase family protein [Caballeronia sp. LZ065]